MTDNLVIFRDQLLRSSETFIRAQAEALTGYTPYYVGSRLVNGLSLPMERVLALNAGTPVGFLKETGFKLWGFSPRLYRKLCEIKPKLVHAHFGPDAIRVLSLVKTLKLPLIVTFHGFDATTHDEYAKRSFYGHKIYIRRREELKRTAVIFIAVSRFIKNQLINQGFSPEKIIVHYTGIDTDYFRPQPDVQRKPLVLFVGRLVEKKGCEYLIRAMSEVQKYCPDSELLVVGEGPLRPKLEVLAQKTIERYKFLGYQSPEQIRAWMCKASVFTVPSVTARSGDAEGFGMVFAEAQASGLPVVSFASGGVPEAVADGQTGFLAQERDHNQLAEYIIKLMQSKPLWQKLSSDARKRACAQFDLSKQTHALEEIYSSVIENARCQDSARNDVNSLHQDLSAL